MDLTQLFLGGITGGSLIALGFYVYQNQSRMSAKQAEDNKDTTPQWLAFAGQTLKGFDAVLEALRGFSARVDSDNREHENLAREQVKLLASLSEIVTSLSARIDAESATIRQAHTENIAKLETLTAIATASVKTTTEALQEVKMMKDETHSRASVQAAAQAAQHNHIVETLTAHGLKIEQINRIVESAAVLKEGGLDELVTRLTKAVSADTVAQLLRAMAETQPIAPVQPDATNIVQNVTVNPETEKENTDDKP